MAIQQEILVEGPMSNPEELGKNLPDQLGALKNYALRLTSNISDADDLLQETCARALANAHQFAAGTELRSWLFTIARNTWFNEYRRRTREFPGAEPTDHPGCCAADQEWRLHVRDVAGALDRVSDEHASLISFVALGEGSYEDAAKQFGCETGTVKSRLSRGRRALAAEMRISSSRELKGGTPGPLAWSHWQTVPLR